MYQTKSTIWIGLGVSISFLLSGCGGGGGGSSSVTTDVPTSTPPSSVTTYNDTVDLTTLSIDPNNQLSSIYQVNVDVSLPHLSASQVYIAICDNAGGGIDAMNYDSCLLKAQLQSGTGQYQLRVPNHCDSLIAVVSIMTPHTSPLVYILEHDNAAETTWVIQ